MFRDNRRYIAENDTRDDYICLDLRLSSPEQTWDRAIEIMRGRIEGRYLGPMRSLIQADPNKNGFAAMALCCLLIETLLQFREGFPRTPDRENRVWYSRFLHNQLGHVFSSQMADRFYYDIRCGILHSAQTKNNSCLTFDTDYVVKVQGNGVMMVDVQGMYHEIDHYFRRYCEELVDPDNIELRKSFINKMDDITKKWEGIKIIDNLWFAICEKENRGIICQGDRSFRIEVISQGTALRLVRYIKGKERPRRISKYDVEDALYYWPNQSAIKMLNKGSDILCLFNLCSDIANDIIDRQIA